MLYFVQLIIAFLTTGWGPKGIQRISVGTAFYTLCRTSAEDITVFDSTGIALQDLASAARILEAAEKNNVGVIVEL
ncbi:MAG: hypothetical protein PUB75_00140 [Firmicutes bacterium]|nr:hypothetical protein [Bacillota bacterium]